MSQVRWLGALGTFALVFAGTGAIIINDVTKGAVTHVGIALTFGLVIVAMICTLGEVSGAHFNPVVSIAFALRKELPRRDAAAYVAMQIVGALAGVWIAHLMFELPLWQLSSTARTVTL